MDSTIASLEALRRAEQRMVMATLVSARGTPPQKNEDLQLAG